MMKATFGRLLSLVLLCLCIGMPVHSAFDRPLIWSPQTMSDHVPKLAPDDALQPDLLNLAAGDSALELALTDSSNKIDPQFHVTPELQKSVRFWLKIYTQLTSRQMVFYDRLHPEVIYEVVDFTDLLQKSKNAVVFDILKERRIKAKVQAYHGAFAQLAKKRKSKKPDPYIDEESKILTAWSGHPGRRPSIKELRSELRSQTGQRDNVIHGLFAAEAYFPKMEQVFSQLGIPRELTRLSLVESSFELRANSRVGAIGVWQFMPGPGGKLMLVSENQGIDERLSPLKSTVAAGLLLRDNFHRFKNWPLTVTAYNHGLRGLKPYQKSGADSKKVARLFDLSSKNSPLGFAAKNYYAEFLAMVHAEAYRQLFYGDIPMMSLRAVAYQPVFGNKSALKFAMENGISLEQFRAANPEIIEVTSVLPNGILVAIPSDHDDLTALTKKPKKRGV